MSLGQVDHVASVCWNCDQAVAQIIKATLQMSSGRSSMIPLCQPCFVSVYLPLVADARVPVPDAGRSRNVLVVDDDPDIRRLLTRAFEDQGFRVDTATNGLEALEKARIAGPDAIVLDLCMPVMSGQEFLDVWRKTPQATVPVLAISAYGLSTTAEDLGVQAFLAKPFTMSALLNTVEALVGAQDSAGAA